MNGCLCLHGFTGGPYEVAPLVEYLQEQTNWILRVPTLPGHGETASLKGIHYQEWINHAETELKNLFETCDKVFVVGFSMGGLIASFLAANYPVDRLVLLSAAVYYVNPKQMAVDVKSVMRDLFNGCLQDNELFLRYRRKIMETPLTAAWEFRRLVSFIKPTLSRVEVPTFIAQGECDGIVPSKSAAYLYETIGAAQKSLYFIKESKHHICFCEENVALFSEVLNFLQEQ